MITQDFVLAGNATFTLEIPAAFAKERNTKPHYTYKVTYSEPNGQWAEAYWVGLLTGSDNENSFSRLGKLDPVTGEVRLVRGACATETSYCFRLLERALACVWDRETVRMEAAGFDLHHEGKCGKCGRKLTVPSSVESGIGPECAKKMGVGHTRCQED